MYKFIKPNRPVSKVFIHCSASDDPAHDNVATMDAWHKALGWSGVGYHFFNRKSGQGEIGRSLEKTPAAQKGHNTESIAICLHGLVEDKFTDEQKAWLVEICWQINEAYKGKVTFHGHKEVANKTCPVLDYKSILGLDEHGRLTMARPDFDSTIGLISGTDLIAHAFAKNAKILNNSLSLGDNGMFVTGLQKNLDYLGYHVGAIDGHFGALTRAAVLTFQADNYLIEDGIVGPATFEAFGTAEPRSINPERANATIIGMAAGGSRIAQASVAQGALGSAIGIGGVLSVVDDLTSLIDDGTETATGIAQSLSGAMTLFNHLGPAMGSIAGVCGLLVVLQAMKAGKARRDDHRTAKTL